MVACIQVTSFINGEKKSIGCFLVWDPIDPIELLIEQGNEKCVWAGIFYLCHDQSLGIQLHLGLKILGCNLCQV